MPVGALDELFKLIPLEVKPEISQLSNSTLLYAQAIPVVTRS